MWFFTKTIFDDIYDSSLRDVVKLDAAECSEMLKSKICTKRNGVDIKLECNGDYCSVKEKLVVPYLNSIFAWGKNVRM